MKSAARCSKSWRVLHQFSSLRTSCSEVVVVLVMSSLGSLVMQGEMSALPFVWEICATMKSLHLWRRTTHRGTIISEVLDPSTTAHGESLSRQTSLK